MTKFIDKGTTLMQTQHIVVTIEGRRVGYGIIKWLQRRPYMLYQYAVYLDGQRGFTGKTKYLRQINCFDRMVKAIRKVYPNCDITTTGYARDSRDNLAIRELTASKKYSNILAIENTISGVVPMEADTIYRDPNAT